MVSQNVEEKIYEIRGFRVMLDEDLAALYGVRTKVFNQAVKRNFNRFPTDFMFRLTKEEYLALRSQIVTLKPGRGRHRKFLPLVFTEQGVAMLSGILQSDRAVATHIAIMRAFVKLRAIMTTHKDLLNRLEAIERTIMDHHGLHEQHTTEIQAIFHAIRQLMHPRRRKPSIGFKI